MTFDFGTLMLLFTLTFLPAETGNSTDRCLVQDAVDCLALSSVFNMVDDEEEVIKTECWNVSQSLDCLDGFLSRCEFLAHRRKSENFYTKFRDMLQTTKSEYQDHCNKTGDLRHTGRGSFTVPQASVLFVLLTGVMGSTLCRLLT